MKLLTKELCDQIPMVGAQDGKGEDAVVWCKFFTVWTQWTWFVLDAYVALEDGSEAPLAGWDGKTGEVVFFGYVKGQDEEYGYFALSELEGIRGPGGLTIERDLYWNQKTTMREVLAGTAR